MGLIKRFGGKKGSVMLGVLGAMTLLVFVCASLFFSLAATSDESYTEVKNQQVYLAAQAASNFTLQYIMNACEVINNAGNVDETTYDAAVASHPLIANFLEDSKGGIRENDILTADAGNFAFGDTSDTMKPLKNVNYDISIERLADAGGYRVYEVRTKAVNNEGISKTFTNGFRIKTTTTSSSNEEEDTPFKYGLMSIAPDVYRVKGVMDFPYYLRNANNQLDFHGTTYFDGNIYAHGNVNTSQSSNYHFGYSKPINIFIAGPVTKDSSGNVISVGAANLTTGNSDHYFLDHGGYMYISGNLDVTEGNFGVNTTGSEHAHIFVGGNVTISSGKTISNTTFHLKTGATATNVPTGNILRDFDTAKMKIPGSNDEKTALAWLSTVPDYTPEPWSYKTVPKNNNNPGLKFAESDYTEMKSNQIKVSATAAPSGNGVTKSGDTTTITQSGRLVTRGANELGMTDSSNPGHTVIFDTTKGTDDTADDENMIIFLDKESTGDPLYLFSIDASGYPDRKVSYVNYLVKGAGSVVFVLDPSVGNIKNSTQLMFGKRTFIGHADWAKVFNVPETSALWQTALADVGNNSSSPPALPPATSRIRGMIHNNINDGSYDGGDNTATNCWYCNNPDEATRKKWLVHNDGLFRVNGMLRKYGSDNATPGTAPSINNKAGNYSNYGDLHNNIYLCDLRGYTITTDGAGNEVINLNTTIEDNYFQDSVGGYFLYIYSPANNLKHDSNNDADSYYGQVFLGGAICKNFQAVNDFKFKFVYAKPANYYYPGSQSWSGNNFVYMADKLVYPPPLDSGEPTGFSYTEYSTKNIPYYN